MIEPLDLVPPKQRSRTTYEYNAWIMAVFWLWHIVFVLFLVYSLANDHSGKIEITIVAAFSLLLEPWAYGAVILGSVAYFTRRAVTITETLPVEAAPVPANPVPAKNPHPRRGRGEPSLS